MQTQQQQHKQSVPLSGKITNKPSQFECASLPCNYMGAMDGEKCKQQPATATQ